MGNDEPYVLVVAVALTSTVQGIPIPAPVSDVVVYPFREMRTNGRARFGEFESFWGIGRTRSSTRPATSRKVPHTGMRRSIAQHMVQSVAVAPHITTVFEADLSAIVAHREAHRAAFEADGIKLTCTAYFVRASVAALQAVPEVNSRWHEDALSRALASGAWTCHLG